MATAKRMNPALVGLQHSLRIHTGRGDFDVDPAADPLGYKHLLEESADERVRADREAAADAYPDPLAMGRNPGLEAFNRSQQDMATGPGGYNRQWTSFLEAPRVLADNTGMRVNVDPRGSGLPADAPVDSSGEGGPYGPFGTMATNLAGLSAQRPQKPMPESHESFMARMAQKYGKR